MSLVQSYYKEEKYYKNKVARLLILFLGEAFIAFLILIISQLLKANGALGIPVQNYFFAVFFIITLILAILFSWGGYLMGSVINVNYYGVSLIFKMPPLIKRKKKILKDSVKKIYWHPSNRVIYEGGQLKPAELKSKNSGLENTSHCLVVFESYNGSKTEFETLYPEALESAMGKLFMKKGS